MFTGATMDRIRNRIIIFSFAVFVIYAVFFAVNEIKHDFFLYKDCSRAADDDKRVLLVGDLYVFIQKCRLYISDDSSILLITDNPGEGLLLSYHLYPRKLYFYNYNPVRQFPVKIKDLDPAYLEQKRIKWIISRFSKKHVDNKLLQIENGEVVKIIDAEAV
jgi:hypothetical protein